MLLGFLERLRVHHNVHSKEWREQGVGAFDALKSLERTWELGMVWKLVKKTGKRDIWIAHFWGTFLLIWGKLRNSLCNFTWVELTCIVCRLQPWPNNNEDRTSSLTFMEAPEQNTAAFDYVVIPDLQPGKKTKKTPPWLWSHIQELRTVSTTLHGVPPSSVQVTSKQHGS